MSGGELQPMLARCAAEKTERERYQPKPLPLYEGVFAEANTLARLALSDAQTDEERDCWRNVINWLATPCQQSPAMLARSAIERLARESLSPVARSQVEQALSEARVASRLRRDHEHARRRAELEEEEFGAAVEALRASLLAQRGAQ